MKTQRLFRSNEDFFMALLRHQTKELSSLLTTIEDTQELDEHVENSLRRVEGNIRSLRKICSDN